MFKNVFPHSCQQWVFSFLPCSLIWTQFAVLFPILFKKQSLNRDFFSFLPMFVLMRKELGSSVQLCRAKFFLLISHKMSGQRRVKGSRTTKYRKQKYFQGTDKKKLMALPWKTLLFLYLFFWKPERNDFLFFGPAYGSYERRSPQLLSRSL